MKTSSLLLLLAAGQAPVAESNFGDFAARAPWVGLKTWKPPAMHGRARSLLDLISATGAGTVGGQVKPRPPIKDLFENAKKGHLKNMKMSELRDASRKMKQKGGDYENLTAEDVEDAFALLKDFAKDKDVDKAGLADDAVVVMSDMMDKELMRKARESLKHHPPAKRKEFERKVSSSAKETRHAIAKYGLKGKAAGFENKLEEDGLRMRLAKKPRAMMGTADTMVRAHDSGDAAAFKLPKGITRKLPSRVVDSLGVVAWENPSAWTEDGKTVKSKVSGLSFFDDAGEPITVRDLADDEVIEIEFPVSAPKARCSYWDTAGTEWKTDGVETEHHATHTICKTRHLTEFALVESDADDSGWYPCKGHDVGAACHMCAPGDTTCTESAEAKVCKEVTAGAPLKCVPDSAHAAWSPCKGKAMGAGCHMCPPSAGTSCKETNEYKTCKGVAGSADLACMVETQAKAVLDNSHVCHDPTTFNSEKVIIPGANRDGTDMTCADGAMYIGVRMPKPWKDITCADIAAVPAWDDNGTTHTAKSALGYMIGCCGSEQPRCAPGTMCKDKADFNGTKVFHSSENGEVLTCLQVGGWIGTKMPKPWDELTCADIAATSWEEEGGEVLEASKMLNMYGSSCCGSAAAVRCNDGSNMCKNNADFLGDLVVEGDTWCQVMEAHLGSKIPKPWNEMTCADVRNATWTEEDGSVSKASDILARYGPLCCGSAVQTRCSDGSNICKISSDFRASAVLHARNATEGGDITCAAIAAHIDAKRPKPWSEMTCADIASTTWVEDGREQKMSHYVNGMGPVCCGSAVQTRCNDGSNMCRISADFKADKVIARAEGGDLTCASYAPHALNNRLPKPWSALSCDEFRAVSWTDKESGEVEKALSVLDVLGPMCCGSAAQTRCIDDSNMCRISADFKADKVISRAEGGDVTCASYAPHLNKRLPKPWSELSCEEFQAVSWTDKGGHVAKAPVLLSWLGPTCCGSAAQARCMDTSNMCENSADFTIDLVLDGDTRCGNYAAHVFGNMSKQWDEMTCEKLATEVHAWHDHGKVTFMDMLKKMGPRCCGSAAKARCASYSGSSYNSGSSGSNGSVELIAQLRALLDHLSGDTEAVGRLHAKLAEVEAATAGCNHDGTVAVASAGPMEPLTCGGATSTGEVQFLPVSEMFKPNLEGRLADAQAKGGQMCFCR